MLMRLFIHFLKSADVQKVDKSNFIKKLNVSDNEMAINNRLVEIFKFFLQAKNTQKNILNRIK